MIFFYLFGLHEWLFSFGFSSYNDCAILIHFTCASCPFSHLIPTDFSSLVMYCESASDEAYQSVIVSTLPLLYQNIFLSILFPCVVGIAAGYELVGPGIKSRWVEIFHTRRKRAGTHPASGLLCIGDRLILGGESAGGVAPTLDKEQSSTIAPFTPVSWLQVTGCNIIYFGRQCFTAIHTAYVYLFFFFACFRQETTIWFTQYWLVSSYVRWQYINIYWQRSYKKFQGKSYQILSTDSCCKQFV